MKWINPNQVFAPRPRAIFVRPLQPPRPHNCMVCGRPAAPISWNQLAGKYLFKCQNPFCGNQFLGF